MTNDSEVEAVARAVREVILSDSFEIATAAIAAHKAHLSASGYVIVPREPTEAMKDAAHDQLDWGPSGYCDAEQGASSADLCWKIMIDAALSNKGE